MQNSVSIKIPNHLDYYPILENTLIQLTPDFTQKSVEKINLALKELIKNSITHSYQDREGLIQIDFTLFLHGIRVDITDWGVPMSSDKIKSVSLDKGNTKGFNKIYNAMDKFEYRNLGTEGKKFTIIKYSSKSIKETKEDSTHLIKSKDDTQIVVREFRKGDESGISKLIYENYGLSYIKDIFYYPTKILEYHGDKFYSIVVATKNSNEIIGHFAFIMATDSNIAEIGIAVVSHQFQGKGLMGLMFDKLLIKAKSLQLDALYGEAIMYHVFSQKSNLKHNFSESAIEIGKLIETVDLEGNIFSEMNKRGSILLAHKLLKPIKKSLFIPTLYRDKVIEIYNNCNNINYTESTQELTSEHSDIRYKFDSNHNIATIIIDAYNSTDFHHTLHHIIDQLRARHCDMIYADINMERITQIDEVVKLLNLSLFFFSGVLFLRHHQEDYLHLQYKHSTIIGKENLVCHSSFCQSLLKYILEDEARVRKVY